MTVRRFFGGAGLYADGIMFGLVSRQEVIYLKADPQTCAAFEREGSVPFSYQRRGVNRAVMSFWRLPERLYDDPEELATWAEQALAVARRANARRTQPKSAGRQRRSGRKRAD